MSSNEPQSADMSLNEPKQLEIGLNKLKRALSSNDPKWPSLSTKGPK